MSRVSRKSELSPSITKSSNGIDLGKNSGIDLGKKTQPSITSGGVGLTQEVTNVGGMSVSAGANIDISPLDFNINVNPSEGTLSVATEAEIPGGLLGMSGGLEVDLNTGEVIGGSIGAEVGGLGINISNSQKGGLGIEFTYQIGLIELSLGFGFPPKDPKDPKDPKNPENPINIDNLPPRQPDTKWQPPGGINADSVQGCTLRIKWDEEHTRINPYAGTCESFLNGYSIYPAMILGLPTKVVITSRTCSEKRWSNPGLWFMQTVTQTVKYDCEVHYKVPSKITQEGLYQALNYFYFYFIPTSYVYWETDGELVKFGGGFPIVEWRKVSEPAITVFDCITEKPPNIYTPSPPPNQNTPRSAPFPNPPPRKQKKMDACCRENLAFLRVIYTRLGLARFPGQLPNTIIQEISKESEQPAEPPQVPIPDLVSLLNWQFERDDERWGQWQIQIDIKDSDITKEGAQKKSIKLPNLAESIAEFEGQLLSIMTNVDALVALQVKNLAESGMARQEAIKGYLASKAIIKYMAFKSTEIDIPIPMTFTAGAETISKLLEESEGHIKGTDYVEKETLRDVYLDLLQAAAIIRAVHWQRIDTKTDTKSQLLNILKGTVDLAASITKPQTPNGDGEEKKFNPENNFEDFIDSVEDGFRNTTGITDIQNPYGKSPDRRPRIRQIGDNISQAGESN